MTNSSKNILPTMHKVETICAIATSIGQSGIGVIRISGPFSKLIANKVLNVKLEPRVAYYGAFMMKKVIKLIKV